MGASPEASPDDRAADVPSLAQRPTGPRDADTSLATEAPRPSDTRQATDTALARPAPDGVLRGDAVSAGALLPPAPPFGASSNVDSIGADRPSVDTLCAQAAQGRLDGEPLVVPLVPSTTFAREGLASGAEHQYTRVSNPTVAALERALGRLEDAPPAVCFGSGLAAETALFLALLSSGDHVVCSRALYGGTTRLLEQVLGRLGVTASFVETTDLGAVHRAVRPTTKLVFVETPANPTLDVTDIAAVADVAHRAGALLAVDNTFLTAALQRPLDLGADVTVTSTTKFVDGHSAALGGCVVTRDEARLEQLGFVRKCTGAIQSPWNAWLTLQGLKTLPLRLRRQSESAELIATWLTTHPDIVRVHYPTFDARRADLTRRQHLGAHGAVVAFALDGGRPAAERLVQRTRLARLVEHVGSVETLLTHSASMTHASVPPEQRRRVGVTDGLLRLSVGLEDVDELIADLEHALAPGDTAARTARGVEVAS